VIARHFDPAKDSVENIARLSSYPKEVQDQMAVLYKEASFPPENLIVLEVDGEIVGQTHIHDGGFPWAVLDGTYIKPEHRNFKSARTLLEGVYAELLRRGTPLVGTYTTQEFAKALEYGGWTRGYEPLVLMIRPVIPKETQ